MIEMVNVSYARPAAEGRRVILHHARALFPPLSRTAIIGAPGSGKTTLAQLLSGTRQPDAGHVLRHAAISPVLGHSAALSPNLSGYENAVHLARLSGAPVDRTLAFAEQFSGLGPAFRSRLAFYTANMRARLAFALSYAVPYPFLLADDAISAGDTAFKSACHAMLHERVQDCGLILIAGQTALAEALCDRFFALVRGRLLRCASACEAFDLAYFAETGTDLEAAHG